VFNKIIKRNLGINEKIEEFVKEENVNE